MVRRQHPMNGSADSVLKAVPEVSQTPVRKAVAGDEALSAQRGDKSRRTFPPSARTRDKFDKTRGFQRFRGILAAAWSVHRS